MSIRMSKDSVNVNDIPKLKGLFFSKDIDSETGLPVLPHESMLWYVSQIRDSYYGGGYEISLYAKYFLPSTVKYVGKTTYKPSWFKRIFRGEKESSQSTQEMYPEEFHETCVISTAIVRTADFPIEIQQPRIDCYSMKKAELSTESIQESALRLADWWNVRAEKVQKEIADQKFLGYYPPNKLTSPQHTQDLNQWIQKD